MSHFDRGTDAKVEKARTRASSGSRRTDSIRQAFTGRRRRTIAFLASAMLLGTAAIAIAGPSGEWLEGGDQATGGVVKFGPINPVNGFPDWYRDSNGIEVEPCLSNFDPNCNAPTPAPDPNSEVSFPDNFPDEFFYFTGEASLTANGGNDVLALYTIEGTYGGGNTQTVFGRTRYRIRGGLVPGAHYKITNPYGIDTVEAGDDGSVFVTDDVGVGSRNFGGLFQGQVGPFLKWDNSAPAPPAGYLGDPTVEHKVTGSTYETNYVKIEGPGVGGDNNPNPCPNLTATTSPDCIYTDLFSILGKKSTRAGVDVARASYSRSADSKTELDVMAESKDGQDIVVRDTVAGAGRHFAATPLDGEGSRYYTRVDVPGELPTEVEVVNRKDTPQTVQTVKVTDTVLGTALYDGDSAILHVQAESSDKAASPKGLTVEGFETDQGDLVTMDGAGSADIVTKAPPTTVQVTSDHGGSVMIPVAVEGAGHPPLPLAAIAGGDQSVEQGTTVELSGSASTGDVDSYEWTGPADVEPPIAIAKANEAKATVTAPRIPGDYEFTLTVKGPAGTSTDKVVVTVKPLQQADARIAFANSVVADAATVTVPQNMSVTLDGGPSVSAGSFTWSQVSGAEVSLGDAKQQKLTFLFPKTTRPVVLKLDIRHPGVTDTECSETSCNSTTITLNPELDNLAIGRARFTPNASRWVLDGTASSTKGSNKVAVYAGYVENPKLRIGTAAVDAAGTWSLDERNSAVPDTSCKCVSAFSERGGKLVGVGLEKAADLPTTTVDPGPNPNTQAAARSALTAAVPFAGALAAARFTAPASMSAAAVGTTGVPVTVSVPAGASLVRLRVLTTANKALFSTSKKVKGATKVKVKIRSAKLGRTLRAGKRYVLEVRAGTAKNRLGKATRKAIRARR